MTFEPKGFVVHTFEHKMFGTLRTFEIDGELWFVLADAARALGYQRTEKAKRHLGDTQYSTPDRGTWADLGGRGSAPTIITEGGLYQLVLRSDQKDARRFQAWVTDEVLPALRRKGSYDIEADDGPAAQRQLMADMRNFFEYAAPRAKAHDAVHATSGGYSLAETARRMGRGHHELTELLRSAGVLDHRCAPTEFGVSSGLVARREKTAVVPEDSYERLRGFVMRRPM